MVVAIGLPSLVGRSWRMPQGLLPVLQSYGHVDRGVSGRVFWRALDGTVPEEFQYSLGEVCPNRR
jgi:hypothetical protein